MPTRRRLLGTTALLGTGSLVGCIAPGGASSTTPPAETGNGSGSGSTRPEGTGGPAVTLASVARRPELPVRPTVEVTEDVATDDHPPRLRVTVENAADEPITLGEGRAVVFQYVTSESGELTLLPAGEDYPVEAGCWRLTEGIAVTEEYQTVTLEPGETHASDLGLYGAATGEDACLPVGEHRFETTFSVWTGGGPSTASNGTTGTAGTGTPADATWGFTLLLE